MQSIHRLLGHSANSSAWKSALCAVDGDAGPQWQNSRVFCSWYPVSVLHAL